MDTHWTILAPHEGGFTPPPQLVRILDRFCTSHIVCKLVCEFDAKVMQFGSSVPIMDVKQIVGVQAVIWLYLVMCGIPHDRLDRPKRFPRRFPYEKTFFGECVHTVLEPLHCEDGTLKEALEFRGLGAGDVGIHGTADGIRVL